MTVDVWMQHPTQRLLGNEMFESLRRWMGDRMTAAEVPLDVTLAAMDAAGVEIGLLSAWCGPNGLDLVSNDEVTDWVRLHPNRFAAVAAVHLDRPMVAVRELRSRVRDDGFVGLRVVPWLWNAPPTDRRYYPRRAGRFRTSIRWRSIFRSWSSCAGTWDIRERRRWSRSRASIQMCTSTRRPTPPRDCLRSW
jgi:Amidohydrolase